MVNRDLTPEEFADALGEMAPNLAKEGLSVNDEAAAKLLGNIVPNVKAIKSSVNKGIKIQGGSLNALLAPFKLIGSGFKTSLKSFGVDIAKFTNDVKGTFKKLGDKLNLKKQIGDAFSARFKQLQDAIKKPFTSIKNAFSKVGNFFGFRSKEQREEEEARNPAKFIINYLKKNIEPLLRRLTGVGGPGGDGGGGLFGGLGGLPGIISGLGLALSGLLAYFGFEGTAGAGFAQVLGRNLRTILGKGSAFIKGISNALGKVGTSVGTSVANAVRGGAGARVPTAGRGVGGALAGAKGGAGTGLAGRSLAQTQRAKDLSSIIAGKVNANPLSEVGAGGVRDPGRALKPPRAAGGGSGAGGAAVGKGAEKIARSGIVKFMSRLVKIPILAPLIEGALVKKDVSRIANAVNLTEDAKLELIGKRYAQAFAGVVGGIGGGALLGTALGAMGANPITAIIGGILGAFGGDFAGRKLVSMLKDDPKGFKDFGRTYYTPDPDLQKSNAELLKKFPNIINPRSGVAGDVMFSRSEARQFISDAGNVSGLKQNLVTEAQLKDIQKSQQTRDAVMGIGQENGNGTTINDNSQSNATEVNNFTAPGEVQPRNPDPVPDARFMGGYGQLATG